MNEEDIRPEALLRENATLQTLDVKDLLAESQSFVRVSCPACQSEADTPAFTKEGFTFSLCQSCETLYVNPRPTKAMLGHYYSTSRSFKHWNDRIFPATELSRRTEIFAPRAAKVAALVEKHGASFDTLVDAGAGFGTFCEEIKKLNCFDRIIAVEPSLDLAESCAKRGVEVIPKPIEDAQINGVSVITNFELIEHLFEPKDFLLSCAEVLPSNGLLILTTPNIKGFDLQMLQALSENISAPNHLNYFHPESLARLVESCGFEVIETLTPGKLDAELVRKKALTHQLDLSEHPFLKQILLERWDEVGPSFQEFLADNLLSSHLWLVARKC